MENTFPSHVSPAPLTRRDPAVNRTPLRDLVSDDLDQHWVAWSSQHPHLAAAIDRVRLVDAAVDSLRTDPAFAAALRRADLDEHRLGQAARILDLARQHLRQLLPL